MVELTALLLFSNRGSKISCFHSTTNNGWNDILLHTTCQQFIKQEQWERWRAKRQLVSGSSTGSASAGSGGITPDIFWDCIRKILQYRAFSVENGLQCRPKCVLKHFNSENAVPVRSDSFSTIETAFPRVPPRNDHCYLNMMIRILPFCIHSAEIATTCTDWRKRFLNTK